MDFIIYDYPECNYWYFSLNYICYIPDYYYVIEFTYMHLFTIQFLNI